MSRLRIFTLLDVCRDFLYVSKVLMLATNSAIKPFSCPTGKQYLTLITGKTIKRLLQCVLAVEVKKSVVRAQVADYIRVSNVTSCFIWEPKLEHQEA